MCMSVIRHILLVSSNVSCFFDVSISGHLNKNVLLWFFCGGGKGVGGGWGFSTGPVDLHAVAKKVKIIFLSPCSM